MKLNKILNILNEFSFYFLPIITPLLSILLIKEDSELESEKDARKNAIATLFFQLKIYAGLFLVGITSGIASALITIIASSLTTTYTIGTLTFSLFLIPNILLILSAIAFAVLIIYPAIRGIKAIIG